MNIESYLFIFNIPDALGAGVNYSLYASSYSIDTIILEFKSLKLPEFKFRENFIKIRSK